MTFPLTGIRRTSRTLPDHIDVHRMRPNEAAEAMANEAIDIDYEVVNGEQRWTSVGHSNGMRILVVVWTMRGDSVRPVTAFLMLESNWPRTI